MPFFWQHKRPGLVAFDQMGIGINDRHNHRRKTRNCLTSSRSQFDVSILDFQPAPGFRPESRSFYSAPPSGDELQSGTND